MRHNCLCCITEHMAVRSMLQRTILTAHILQEVQKLSFSKITANSDPIMERSFHPLFYHFSLWMKSNVCQMEIPIPKHNHNVIEPQSWWPYLKLCWRDRHCNHSKKLIILNKIYPPPPTLVEFTDPENRLMPVRKCKM